MNQERPASFYESRRLVVIGCILFTATLLNYANRFAFTQNAQPIRSEFELNEEQYGIIAGDFGIGFAIGGLLFGILADKISVRVLYPVVVLVWSCAGMCSGWISSFGGLAASRFVLGLFEAGHWPCALRTTQRLFRPHQRTWANSILQSGASMGAVFTPLLVLALYEWDPDRWRAIFFIVGGLGLPWAVAWWITVRESDVRRPVIQTDEAANGIGREVQITEIPFYRIFTTRRWYLLLAMVICINTLWHYIRVWMPIMLVDDHGYSHQFVQYFTSAYYLATFFGSLCSGFFSGWLVRQGWNVHQARLRIFLVFAVISSLAIPAAFLPRGPLLLGTLLLVAFGSLGLFPIYYSLNQEISGRNQGKVGGSLGFSTWLTLYFMHPMVGRLVDQDPTVRPWLLATVGLGPLLAYFVIRFCWGQRPQTAAEATS